MSGDGIASVSQSIVGGTYEPGLPAIVAVVTEDGALRCSASVIAPYVVMTAGHCIVDGERPLQISLGPDLSGQKVASVDTVLHPLFEVTGHLGSSYAHDIALLRTADRLDIAPISFAEEVPAIGTFVEVVGYGRYEPGSSESAGIRRVGDAQVSAVNSLSLDLLPGPEQPCFFDSGGPAFGADLHAVGVISTGDGKCAEAAHVTRLDTELEFIDAYLQSVPEDASEASQQSPDRPESACQLAAPLGLRPVGAVGMQHLAVLGLLASRRRSKPPRDTTQRNSGYDVAPT